MRIVLTLSLLLSALSVDIRSAPTSFGGKGLWRVLSGDIEGRGALSFSLHTQWWTKKYDHSYGLNTHRELLSCLGVGYCPWNALGLSVAIPVNSYWDTEPQSERKLGLGDLRVAVALSRSIGRTFRFGVSGYSVFPSGEDTFYSETGKPFSSGARQLGGVTILTADLGDRGEFPPLRLHLNAGYHRDYAEVGSGDDNLNDYLPIGVGLELPTQYFTPFLEFTSEQHIHNDTMSVSESPIRFTPGLRFTKSGFNVDLAWDINLSGELPNEEKIDPHDWRLLLGIAWVRGPGKLPLQGSIAGTITDFETGQPLTASISFLGRELASLESDPLTGSFSAEGISAGLLTMKVEKEGYKEKIAPIFVKAGEVAVRDFALKRADREATISGKVTDGFSGEPVSARLSFGEFETDCNSEGNFETVLAPGDHSIRVSCPGYFDRWDTLTIRAGEEVMFQVSLGRIGPTTIEGVGFQRGQAELLPESWSPLESVAQFLKENPELKIEIQGHTDSQGSNSFNLRLSRRRADAVKAHLVEEFGIESKRLLTKGYGESAPVADNSTEEGRRRNRRIDLLILKE